MDDICPWCRGKRSLSHGYINGEEVACPYFAGFPDQIKGIDPTIYPPTPKTEEEMEERIIWPEKSLEELRYVHGGDLHIHDWKCHA